MDKPHVILESLKSIRENAEFLFREVGTNEFSDHDIQRLESISLQLAEIRFALL